MQHITHIDERVKVLAVFADDEQTHICTPLKMKYRGREYVFTEIGLRHPTVKGQRMRHVFDVTDGSADYRLEFDAQRLVWTLVYMAEVGV